MKKLLSFLLAFILIIGSIVQVTGQTGFPDQKMQAGVAVNPATLTKVSVFDYQFKPATEIWRNMVGSAIPATLKDVKYELADNMVQLQSPVTQNIRSASQVLRGVANTERSASRIIAEGGFINKTALQQAANTSEIRPGTVYYDTTTKTAFKVVTSMSAGETTKMYENDYAVTKPELHEIIKDFSIPDQKVKLNKANISGFADPKIEQSIVQTGASGISFGGITDAKELPYAQGKYTITQTAGGSEGFKYLSNPLIAFNFPKIDLNGNLADGSQITVKVNGALGLGDLELEGSYSGMGGYKLGLSCSQEAYLNVDVGVNVNKEIRIPLMGVDIDFAVGRITGGLFLVVNIDGSITIELKTRAWATETVGVSGGTFLFVPVSVHPYFEFPNKGVSGDVQIDGKINGTIKAGAMLSLEICGFELAGAGAFVGAGLDVASDGAMLDIRLYGLVQLYIAFMGDHYNLVNYNIDVFRRQQKDMGGYRVKINEACVYQDRVGGVIEYNYGAQGRLPEKNAKFRVRVTPADTGVPVEYKPTDGSEWYTTDLYGEFVVYGVPLSMNDKVELLVLDKVTNTVRESGGAKPTFPFRSVMVNDADYFNDWVAGQVRPVKVRKWGYYAPDGEPEYETLFYSGPVTIRIMKEDHGARVTEQSVIATTDELGVFKAENLETADGDPMNVKPSSIFGLSLEKDGFLVNDYSTTEPKVQFQLKRVVTSVDGSQRKFNEGANIVDQSVVLERYYFINLRGSKQLSGNDVNLEMCGFSTQDVWARHSFYYKAFGYGQETTLAYLYGKGYLPAMYPKLSGLKITPEPSKDGIPNGTSFLDNKVVREWIWHPHSNPTVITSPSSYTGPAGSAAFKVTATGVSPFTFGTEGAPDGISVDISTGELSVSRNVQPGSYSFNMTALSFRKPPEMQLAGQYPVYREDDYPLVKQPFTLTVTAPEAEATASPTAPPDQTPSPTPVPEQTPSPTPVQGQAPTITSANLAYIIQTGGTFQVTATGTAPIKYSLSSLSPIAGVPPQITIDQSSGLITVARGLSTGSHQFYVNASNGVSPDAKQFFTLVISPMVYSLDRNIDAAARPAFIRNMINAIIMPTFKTSSQNTITLRNDDPDDLYTTDSLWVPGSEYIKWDSILTVFIEGMPTNMVYMDGSPSNDHHLFSLTDAQREELKQANDAMMKEQYTTGFGFDENDGFSGGPGGQDDFAFGTGTVFDFGSVLDGISKGGGINVGLGGSVGGVVPGDIFSAMRKKPGSLVSFVQAGAGITFKGSSIGKVTNDDLFDFTFSNVAPHASDMTKAAPGATSFTYSFAHNNKLPGYASFEIDTGMMEGTKVNVYKFDAGSNKFQQIAGGLTVAQGGKVTYKNNTTSEYIITTGTISGASKADAFARQGDTVNIFLTWWFKLACGLLLASAAAFAVWYYISLKRRKAAAVNKPEDTDADSDETPLPQN